MHFLFALPSNLMIFIIKAYQKLLSPLLGQNCRFNPTCSSYAIDAIKIHGFVKGSWFAANRIIKCHPLHPGGDDPVPDKQNSIKQHHEK
ncbi:membrane protein insertion efficiency factor YidD [Pseudoalteromonas piratica]|jgi:putative membrane protein insertion efficiency factor|uniref:Putative membrane protein insertion efficiency factor n=1 Tax=Pseudoalteromonas piratica TaxID=1348114 RepID=A0A0A7ECN6_9GAMM|nr:membrane protein insertion efficiency factor YidD [Pseudoalteromonas piratica]AIY64273.1 membrane protein [Pseudoalteromonas piratica]